MIAVDTSVLVAILLQEPDAPLYARALGVDDEPLMSAASLVELRLVMKHRQGLDSQIMIDRLINRMNMRIVPVSEKQAEIAVAGLFQFSILNYGDSFSYALAKDKGVPLLFKGDDFGRTDVVGVL